MQRIFLDANILVTVLCNEYPRFGWCARVLSLCDDRRFEVFTSPLCLAIGAHFSTKKNGRRLAKKKIALLAGKLRMTAVDGHTVEHTLGNPAIEDFEDGLEYYSAKQAGCTCIITYDRNDFHFGELEVLNAEDFLVKYVLPLHQRSK